ncbi:hypothetical protein CDD83_10475 [Cordyceps sp. RAO-2017]|nr:hypothetical protein CDD83_10475 [Cordyceps sp. RAO-2017]
MSRTNSSETVTGSTAQQAHAGGENSTPHYIHHLDARDASEGYGEEARVRSLGALDDGTSPGPRGQTELVAMAWAPDDPDNPHNWTNRKKGLVLVVSAVLVINSTMSSSLPSMAVPEMTGEFGVRSAVQRVLPISVFLIGYVFGPLVWGPLSEQLGRRRPTIATFAAFSLSTLACALAPSWPALLVFRFLCGIFASSPIAG